MDIGSSETFWGPAELKGIVVGALLFKNDFQAVAQLVPSKPASEVEAACARALAPPAPAHRCLARLHALGFQPGSLVGGWRREVFLGRLAAAGAGPGPLARAAAALAAFDKGRVGAAGLGHALLAAVGAAALVAAVDLGSAFLVEPRHMGLWQGLLSVDLNGNGAAPDSDGDEVQSGDEGEERASAGAGDKMCGNCAACKTRVWRHGAGLLLCNACGMYLQKHGTHRTAELIVAHLQRLERERAATAAVEDSRAAGAAGGAHEEPQAMDEGGAAAVADEAMELDEAAEGGAEVGRGGAPVRRSRRPKAARPLGEGFVGVDAVDWSLGSLRAPLMIGLGGGGGGAFGVGSVLRHSWGESAGGAAALGKDGGVAQGMEEDGAAPGGGGCGEDARQAAVAALLERCSHDGATDATAELAVAGLLRLRCDTPPASPVKGGGGAGSPFGAGSPLGASSPGRARPRSGSSHAFGAAAGSPRRAAGGGGWGDSWGHAPGSGGSVSCEDSGARATPPPSVPPAVDGAAAAFSASPKPQMTRFEAEHRHQRTTPGAAAVDQPSWPPQAAGAVSGAAGRLRVSDDTRLRSDGAVGAGAPGGAAGGGLRAPQRGRKPRGPRSGAGGGGGDGGGDSDEDYVPGADGCGAGGDERGGGPGSGGRRRRAHAGGSDDMEPLGGAAPLLGGLSASGEAHGAPGAAAQLRLQLQLSGGGSGGAAPPSPPPRRSGSAPPLAPAGVRRRAARGPAKEPKTSSKGPCANCGVERSILWRCHPEDDSVRLCNACGIYRRSTGRDRPTDGVFRSAGRDGAERVVRRTQPASPAPAAHKAAKWDDAAPAATAEPGAAVEPCRPPLAAGQWVASGAAAAEGALPRARPVALALAPEQRALLLQQVLLLAATPGALLAAAAGPSVFAASSAHQQWQQEQQQAAGPAAASPAPFFTSAAGGGADPWALGAGMAASAAAAAQQGDGAGRSCGGGNEGGGPEAPLQRVARAGARKRRIGDAAAGGGGGGPGGGGAGSLAHTLQ
ncbi:MAG: hypothetical protein J3K34DRAFT_487467 [Monoraphidium minutum]|nr:MAG: hypothetical protein J3K34DRAFT_487467 [Monoraphidium minutum]